MGLKKLSFDFVENLNFVENNLNYSFSLDPDLDPYGEIPDSGSV